LAINASLACEAFLPGWVCTTGPSASPTAADLAEQRRFVLWWDGLGDKRGRPEKTSQTGDVFPTVADLGLDRDTIHRWRKKLKAGR